MSPWTLLAVTKMKKCSFCKEEKELDSFTKCKANKDGLDTLCRACKSIKNKTQHFKNREASLARIRNNYRKNIEQRRAYAKEYHRKTDSPEKQAKARERAKRHYWDNKPEGARTRSEYRAWLAENSAGPKVRALRYCHKRRLQLRARTINMTELDEFAFQEAVNLCQLRKAATGLQWDVDHIVPLNHRKASGLHCAANFQVVPHYWNVRKSNTSFAEYDFT